MSGLSEATLAAPDPAHDPARLSADPSQPGRPAPAWPTVVTLLAWTLIGLGISAHDGEWSSWGLAALLTAFAMLLAVAASARTVGVPNRRMLSLPVAVCLLAAVAHPAYRPWTTVLLAPFRWLTTDVRAGLLLATLITSWQVRRLAPAAPAALALLVLIHPHWIFLIDQSWTEPLVLVLLTAALLAISRG